MKTHLRKVVFGGVLGLAAGLCATGGGPVSAAASATVSASSTTIVVPGTFDVEGTFTVGPPYVDQPAAVRVQIQIQGTDGVVTLGNFSESAGLSGCTQPAPGRTYECTVDSINSPGTYTLGATATATAVPTGGQVTVTATVIGEFLNAVNSNLATASPVTVDITSPATSTTVPTTTVVPASTAPVSTTVAGAGTLPATGRGTSTTALIAIGLVLLGSTAIVVARGRVS